MSEVWIPIDLVFHCSVCGKELETDSYDQEILVDPCGDCMDAKYVEGREDGLDERADDVYSI